MTVTSPLALGMHQANRYWRFLFVHGLGDDVRQEVHLAVAEYNPHTHGTHKFNLAVNRRLYSLARSAGFRKRHMNEGLNSRGHAWERRTVVFSELSVEDRVAIGLTK